MPVRPSGFCHIFGFLYRASSSRKSSCRVASSSAAYAAAAHAPKAAHLATSSSLQENQGHVLGENCHQRGGEAEAGGHNADIEPADFDQLGKDQSLQRADNGDNRHAQAHRGGVSLSKCVIFHRESHIFSGGLINIYLRETAFTKVSVRAMPALKMEQTPRKSTLFRFLASRIIFLSYSTLHLAQTALNCVSSMSRVFAPCT